MKDELNIMDYVKVVHKWKEFIISFTSASVVLTVVLCLIMPWTYRAETTILLPQQAGKGIEGVMALTSMLSGSTINMPAEISQSLLGRTTNFSDILRSKSAARFIVNGLNLSKAYKGMKMDGLINRVQKKVKVREQKGVLTIYVFDGNPRLAADIANYAVIALDDFNKKGNMQYARRLKNFVRDQLVAAKVDLSDAEEKLKKFETQSQMVKISEREVLLGRLLREVKVKEAIYTMLLQEYEKSKIDEAKEELFFEVLDPATPPKRPNFPKPFLYSLISVILGASTSVFLAFFFEYLGGLGINVRQIDYRKELRWPKLTRRS